MEQSSILRSSMVYFILCIAISWCAVYFIFGSDGIPATAENQQLVGMAILLGPVISSLVLTLKNSGKNEIKELLSKLIKVNISFKWYAFAILTAPISTFIVVLLSSFISENYTPNFLLKNDSANIIMLGLLSGLFVGLFEEIGWTGYATPVLKSKYGVLTTGIIIGLVWGVWHFILFWEAGSFTNTMAFLLLLARLLAWLPAYRILMVWLYSKTDSLFLNIVMHMFLVASLVIIDPVLHNSELLVYIIIRSIVLWIIVFIVLFSDRKTAST